MGRAERCWVLHHTSALHSMLYSRKMLSCIAGSRIEWEVLCCTANAVLNLLSTTPAKSWCTSMMTKRENAFCTKNVIWNKIIYSSRRLNMHLEYITLRHLFHACALCLCSSILHQSPSSVLTQSLWLGNAERERRWQCLLSYCVPQQSQDRCSSMRLRTVAVILQTKQKAGGKRESCH